MENGREFRLESRLNRVGRYILCAVSSVEAKRYSLFFAELRILLRGWSIILAEKLHHLDVVSSFEARLLPFTVMSK